MHWLIIAIVAYLINAVNAIVDKFLLTRSVIKPVTYSFYIGILGLFVLIFAPFVNFSIPPSAQLFISLFTGGIFILAIFTFFNALYQGETSRILPLVGGLIPLFVFSLSFVFLDERLSTRQLAAFFLLVPGAVLISIKKKKIGTPSERDVFLAILASFIYACAFVATKFVYLNQSFWTGFIWMRIGSFLGALSFLVFPKIRAKIFSASKTVKRKMGILYLSNQGLGGLSFLLQNYAISLASVSLVSALQGTQYAMLMVLIVILSVKVPGLIRGELRRGIRLKRISAIALISAGLLLLVLK